jgi:hypothetical protein
LKLRMRRRVPIAIVPRMYRCSNEERKRLTSARLQSGQVLARAANAMQLSFETEVYCNLRNTSRTSAEYSGILGVVVLRQSRILFARNGWARQVNPR